MDTHNTHELDSAQTPIFPCKRKPEEAKALRELFQDVREVLNELHVQYFLMYGSIWGALRSKGPLPWDYDIDLGVYGDEEFSKIPREKFVKAFQKRGIRVTDKMHQASVFYLSRGKFAQVDLDVFFNYNGWMQRAGWISWVLYYNYKDLPHVPRDDVGRTVAHDEVLRRPNARASRWKGNFEIFVSQRLGNAVHSSSLPWS